MISLFRNITLIFILWESSLSGGEITIDDFEGDVLCHWYSWPRGEIYLELSKESKNGQKALFVNMRESAGGAIRTIYGGTLKETNPYAISFWIKAAKGNQKKEIQVILEEEKGKEKYYTTVKLPQEWTKITINFSDFKIYHWGGAKIVDEKLDTKDIINLRFHSYPQGAIFYVDDITLLTKQNVSSKTTDPEKPSPVLKEIELTDNYPVYNADYPQKVQNVKINNGNFTRNGKPVFLLGGWQTDSEGPPWLFRTLSIDVYPYNATETYTLYPPKSKNGKLDIKWSSNPWYEAIIQRTLKNGIMFWHEHKSHPRYNALREIMPEVVDSGHFVTYDPNSQWGMKFYNEMYKTWMQYTRKYPIFCYELFNEMGYHNTKKTAREKFKKNMEKKYGNIEKADKIWGGSFKSFDEVAPPGFIENKNQLSTISRDVITLEESQKYPNLYIDWVKFQESDCEEAIEKLMKEMRQYDKSLQKFSTLQSHCQLFFDYGDNGVSPESIEKNTDFYTHEVAQTFFVESNKANYQNIKDMLRASLTNDIIRNICDKPIFNGEAPIGISSRIATQEELKSSDLGNLEGEWKFYDATQTEPEKWISANFDDSSWGNIRVPGMWGEQGYNLCKRGLYRKNFRLASNYLKQKEIYLNGKAFADESEIYVNGRFVGRTKGYETAFSFDISDFIKEDNIISVKIINEYFRNGIFYGGIRGYVTINDFAARLNKEPSLAPKHFRSFLWSQIVHGMSGVMVCYDNNFYQFSARNLPRIKKEIESVSEIVLKRPSVESQIAMVYPFETNRGITHSSYIEKLSGPVTNNLSDYYAPLLFSHLGMDVIRNKDILSGQGKKYKLIIMPGNIRILPKELDALYEYASEGGILVVEFGSLSVNDETHEKIDPEKLLGIKVEKLNEVAQILKPGIAGNNEAKTEVRYADKKTFAKAQTISAKVLAEFSDSAPAVTVNKIGKGKVYWIAGKFSYQTTENILKYIFNENALRSQIDVCEIPGKEPLAFVETNLFKKADRYVLFALNWGKSGFAKLRLNSLPKGDYAVRNIATGNSLLTPDGKKYWNSEDLQENFSVKMTSLDPVVLLIEESKLKPLTIKNISPERYEILNQLWTTRECDSDVPVVAFTPGESMSSNYGNQPTADKLLNLCGYKTLSYIKGETALDKIKVLIWTDARYPIENPESYLEFIKNGGGILICGNGMMNYHMKLSPINPLLNRLKITQHLFEWLKTDKPAKEDDILNVSCEDISPHPTTKYVKEFRTACAGKIICKMERFETLIKAPINSNIPGAPVMIAFLYGKGRVVYISDSWWLRPLNFEKADNPQLFLNIVNWLADKPIKELEKGKREKALYITEERLKNAEKAEEDGQFEFKPFSIKETSLGKGGEIKALSGGDPIVDILKN